MNINVIHKLEYFTCGKVYIGQTQFDVKHRMNQHKQGLQGEGKSAAADHVLNNSGHKINLDTPQILARDTSGKGREIKEMIDELVYLVILI